MADTPSPGVTPPEVHPPAARRPADDDLLIDVAGFVRLLWRFRFAILIATVMGGAMGVAYARFLPPRFLGSAVLNLTLAPGTGPGAEELARFQALVRDPAIIAQALTEAGLTDLAPAAVASVVTTKVAPPGTLLLVEAQWSDAETAGRLPSALARRAAVVLEEQRQKREEQRQKGHAENLAALQQNWVDAEQQVQRASAAFVEAWLSRCVALSRVGPAVGQELEETLEELRLLREEIIATWSVLDARQKQLEIDLAIAREASTVAQEALQAAKEIPTPGVGLELIEPSFAPGRRVGLTTNAFLARGLATGLMFAVFAVFFIRGVAANFFGRRI